MDVHLATATVPERATQPKLGAGAPFDELFDGVDDLIKRVADSENPEIRKIRAKVHASMLVVKSAWGEGAAVQGGHPAAVEPGPTVEGKYPDNDQTLSVALLVGVGLGVMMSIQP